MRIEVLNCPVDALTMDETVSIIEKAIADKKQIHHVVVNGAKLVKIQTDPVLRESVVSCDLINADGQGVLMAASMLGKKIPERVTGIDLMEKLVAISAQKGYKIFFLGARQDIVETVTAKYEQQYGNAIIAGFRNGYFKDSEEESIALNIAASQANILFVAMGTPKKENFLFRNKQILRDVNLIMGVGGSFDVIAGKVKRAPLWMQRSGLEWFYRMIQEPGRLFYRYFSTNSLLIYYILKARLSKKA
jgi:N-acetylglucosaminyldiphosphoundecaprenol N-acetyl-beta-D-mannosaminyltransferase